MTRPALVPVLSLCVPLVQLGSINSVEILNSGLDYNPSASTLRTVTPGSGCVLEPLVETWTYNRVTGVDNSATENFDSGNGMIASIDGGQIKDTFGLKLSDSQVAGQ